MIPEELLAGKSWYKLNVAVVIATVLNPATFLTNVERPVIEIISSFWKSWKGFILMFILPLSQSKTDPAYSVRDDAIEVTTCPSTLDTFALAPPPLVLVLSKLIKSSTW